MFYTEKYDNIAWQGTLLILSAMLIFVLVAIYTEDYIEMLTLMGTFEFFAGLIWFTICVTVLRLLDRIRYKKEERIVRRRRYYEL